MTAMGKNGQPSMEEILASIRRIVADDPAGAAPLIDLNRKPAQDNRLTPGAQSRVDDSPDFELPSMFKPGNAAAKANGAPKSVQIGRLTDAIRNVAPKSRLGSAAGTNPGQPKNGDTSAQRGATADEAFGRRPESSKSLSSLRQPGVAGATPCAYNGAPAGAPKTQPGPNSETSQSLADAANTANGVAPQPVQASPVVRDDGKSETSSAQSSGPSQNSLHSGENQQSPAAPRNPPRVMAAFCDTRMVRMASEPDPQSEQHAQSNEPSQSAPATQQETASSAIGSIVPGAMDLPGRTPGLAQPSGSGAPAAETPSAAAAPPAQHSGSTDQHHTPAPAPPPLPEGDPAGAQGHVEDATADLLRPMLRQWLSENMPRMVEKALHIEVAASSGAPEPDDGKSS